LIGDPEEDIKAILKTVLERGGFCRLFIYLLGILSTLVTNQRLQNVLNQMV